MASLITRMIDLEGKLEGTAERKSILYMMADVRGTTGLALANIRAFLLSGDNKFKDNYETLWAKNTRRFNDLARQYNNLSAEQRVAFDQFKAIRSEFQTYPPKMFKIKASKQADLANYWLSSRAAPTAARIVKILNAMVSDQRELLQTDANAMNQLIENLSTLEWVLLAAGVVIALLLAFFLTRMIAGPITQMASTVRQIAERRDLTIELPIVSRDEIGVMAQAFNDMMKVIRETFGVVNNSAYEVASSSLDVAERASGNKKRAQGQLERAQTSEKIISEMGNTAGQVSAAALAQQQAAEQSQEAITDLLNKMDSVARSAEAQEQEVSETMSRVKEMGETGAKVVGTAAEQGQKVEQVTAAITEMSTAVENMQKTVAQASEHGKAALEAADEGHKSVSSTVEGMRAIAESSEQISEIIGVITEIAEQTNLLALNAAVEAARAGVHGKGFAVVADEVGKLAQRSSEAAKEITTLIKNSTTSVSEGVALTDQSQQALARIDERTRVNIRAIDEIAAVSTTLVASTTEVQGLVQEL
ncbi:MAG TPA: methyl-accepting chemotaxis protein, partial [Chromatiales bacterium]|nr:methyl-accepting chemotaxis protein [Chromatiales bacterium]